MLTESCSDAAEYLWRFWGMYMHDPLPYSVYRNETATTKALGLRVARAWRMLNFAGTDSRVHVWDPSRATPPPHLARSPEFAFKHVIYMTRCVAWHNIF